MKELQAIIERLQRDANAPHALATLVVVEGSSYRRAGARLLVNSTGESTGSLSGGCLEADVIERAKTVLAEGQPQTVIYDTTDENDLVWGVGLGCQGIVRVFIERLPPRPAWVGELARNFAERRATLLRVIWEGNDSALLGTRGEESVESDAAENVTVFCDNMAPPTRLLIFGAGDDAQPLVRLAKELGWRVEIIDPRPAFAIAARFPNADCVTVAQPENAATMPLDAWTVAVVMSHRYAFDAPLIRALLPRPLKYIGLLGPRKRSEKILAEIAASGTPVMTEMRQRLYAPVGLDLGGDTPEAVALAVLAEIQAVISYRDARPLRERTRPIHA